MGRRAKIKKGLFITGTDTGVGKTVVSFALGVMFQQRGMDVGVMKPVQCAGSDAQFLKEGLGLNDKLNEINPCFAPRAASPHLAFARNKGSINLKRILAAYRYLRERHEIVLVEGAGGLLVPLKQDYLVADLVRDLDLEVVIVSRPGLGTINHTLLTIHQARDWGLNVRGIIFSRKSPKIPGGIERDNPKIIEKISGVPILGTIPYLPRRNRREVLKRCRRSLDVETILKGRRKVVPLSYQQGDRKYVWHPFTQMRDWFEEEPLIIEEAKGCYVKDIHGRWYLDGVSSLWVNVHGHRRKEIDAAIKAQINKVSHSTLLGLSNVPAARLAEKLVKIAPAGLTKVFYSDSGSTAVEVAIKIGYQYWQNLGKIHKKNIVHFEHSYHGDTLGSVSVGGIDLFHKVYRDLIFKSIKVKSPYMFPLPAGMGREGYAAERLKNFETTIERHHETIAAVVVEPLVQAAAGILVWPNGILKKMADVCRKFDCLLIADEVATGFGRTGRMFACEHENVVPDIMCLAKGLTGGYLPLAATLTTQKIFNGFLFPYKDQKTFFHGHTYTGNPLACAAALANLEVFKKQRTLYNLQPKIRQLADGLRRFWELEHVGDVRQKGFMVGIELVRSKDPFETYPWEEKIGVRVCQQARRHGVILRPLGNVIVLMPPLVISVKDLNNLLEVTRRVIKETTAEFP